MHKAIRYYNAILFSENLQINNLSSYFFEKTSQALGTSNIHRPNKILIEDRAPGIPDMETTDVIVRIVPVRNVTVTSNNKATNRKKSIASKSTTARKSERTTSKTGGKGTKKRRKRKQHKT